MSRKLKSILKNCRSYHSGEIGSDHSIVIANTDEKNQCLNILKIDLQDVTIMTKYKCKMEKYQRNVQQELKNG